MRGSPPETITSRISGWSRTYSTIRSSSRETESQPPRFMVARLRVQNRQYIVQTCVVTSRCAIGVAVRQPRHGGVLVLVERVVLGDDGLALEFLRPRGPIAGGSGPAGRAGRSARSNTGGSPSCTRPESLSTARRSSDGESGSRSASWRGRADGVLALPSPVEPVALRHIRPERVPGRCERRGRAVGEGGGDAGTGRLVAIRPFFARDDDEGGMRRGGVGKVAGGR